MSIVNIKELFCKRVQESDALNIVDDSSNASKTRVINFSEERNEFTSLKEADAGITEYLSDCKGFNAVIKQRFSDFHVHEIDKEGNIIYLTNSDIPVIEEEPVNEDIISEEIWGKLKNLHDKVLESVEIDVTDFSKEKRKDIHRAIKWKYGSHFNSNTTDANNKKILIVSVGKNKNRNDTWLPNVGSYLHFVLFKKNLDTAEAINIIASQLRVKSSNLTYAGTKDKRANTSQMVSMWHLDPKRLNGINGSLRSMKVGNFVYKNTPLKLGDLKGNLFEVALRNVTESDEIINESLNVVKENGFLNYFGLQRFGNSIEIPTHEIGKALAKGDFKSAVELILKPRKARMKPDLREARRIWWETKDAGKAIKCLKTKNRTIEGKLLMGLEQHGKNAYVNALDCIPRNVRLLYLHAYQSFLWNKILSKRIRKFGKNVLEGDLVLVNSEKELENEDLESVETESIEIKSTVRFLSKDELGNFQITDVVHPLPGYNVTYPNNIVKEWYEELLKEDDLTSEHLKQTVKKYSLSGTYRHIVKKVNEMSWNTCYYSDPEEDLILSDLDKINEKTLVINKDHNEKFKAVILKFTLDSSTYATMALREILKIDTSCSHQATLNSYSSKRSYEAEDEPCKKTRV